MIILAGRCMVVDREFAAIYAIFVCTDLRLLGLLWVFFNVPVLSWGDFGFLLGTFGQPLDHFGASWFPFRSPCPAQAHVLGFQQNRTSDSEQMALKSTTCAQKVASRNHSANPANPANRHEVRLGPQLPTPVHSRRGLG